jgi:hypothetical protein
MEAGTGVIGGMIADLPMIAVDLGVMIPECIHNVALR